MEKLPIARYRRQPSRRVPPDDQFPQDIIGEKVFIESEVYVLDNAEKPAGHETIYIYEQIGIGTITFVTTTDAGGRVVLRGYYCTPTTVAADGGGVVIRRDNLRQRYTVTLSSDRLPALESGYGASATDLSSLRQSRAYETCGLRG